MYPVILAAVVSYPYVSSTGLWVKLRSPIKNRPKEVHRTTEAKPKDPSQYLIKSHPLGMGVKEKGKKKIKAIIL